MRQELTNGFGKRYLTIEHEPANGWIRNTWQGLLTVEMVMEGATAVLDTMRETGCHYLLNDNRAVVGSWNEANSWIEQTWMPQALAIGLRRFAHVVAPGVFGLTSAEEMLTRVGERFEMRLFGDEPTACVWLREAQVARRQAKSASSEQHL